MTTIRLWVAVWAARLVAGISRLLGRGGSALPGLVARRIDPAVLRRLSGRLTLGTVLLTGTNGKTTTAAVATHLLRSEGWGIVRNRAGANLMAGLVATLAEAGGWRLAPPNHMALLETDEATMPRAAAEIRPRGIVVTNFFRDQLDRYGELSTTMAYVARGIDHLDSAGFLVLNADDPAVAQLGAGHADVVYFGLEVAGADRNLAGYDVSDAGYCPRCGTELQYAVRYYAHIGHYRCDACGWARPRPTVFVAGWDTAGQTLEVVAGSERVTVPIVVPGVYNVYNQVAAVATAWRLGVAPARWAHALAGFQSAFGRMEKLTVGAHTVWLALVKNPVGFNQVLEAVGQDADGPKVGMIIINDRYADGRDVSWLWDVDFERFIGRTGIGEWWVSGLRAHDMAVRLKYAGVARERIHLVADPRQALTLATRTGERRVIYVMPTYTALLDFRRYLTRRNYVRHFREG